MRIQDLDHSPVHLANGRVELVLDPARGGRILSLRDRAADVEWLVPTPDPATWQCDGDPALWASHPRGGWDECFPSITPASLREHGLDAVGDHGDLWSSPWALLAEPSMGPIGATLSVDAPDGVYSFNRTVELDGRGVRIGYRLRSHTDRDLPYLWSMHPLLPDQADLTHAFPAGTRMLVEYSTVPAVTRGNSIAWAEPVPGPLDWRLGSHPSAPVALKGFVPAPRECSATLGRSHLTFRLDPESTPFVGVWLNYGAWPTTEAADRHVALEPTTAATDDLAAAVAAGQARVLAAHADVGWQVDLDFGEAP